MSPLTPVCISSNLSTVFLSISKLYFSQPVNCISLQSSSQWIAYHRCISRQEEGVTRVDQHWSVRRAASPASQPLIYQPYFSQCIFSVFLSVLLCDHLHVGGREHTRGADQEGATPVDAGRSSVVCLCCCTGTTSPVATTGESRDRH